MQAWRSASVPRVQPEAVDLPPVEVFDSATGRLQPAGPLGSAGADGGDQIARLYVCGITPYDATHLGHANTYVTFDLLNRVWRDRGLDVDYVQNVTDVDDPLLERAEQTGEDWTELAAREIELFRTDMTALNVIPPDHYIGAVESVGLITDLLEQLIARDAVYPVDDPQYPDLYLREEIDPEFGSVSHLDDAAARAVFAERGGDPDRPGKEHPLDSLVWRRARPGEPSWDSPHGRGRPGWHIECTAIALDLLGSDFHVQGGGSDLVFPHHEMCASCARLATGEPFAQTYVHAGMVGLDGEKMSKSKGNLVLVSKLRLDGEDPMAIRLVLLAQHYRDDWSWTPQLQEAARQRLDLWRRAAAADLARPAAEVIGQIRSALGSDLDAPTAVAAVDAWARQTLAQGSDLGLDADAPGQVAATVDALLGVRL